MNLDKARTIVAEYLRTWTTQKLCEVLAFAEDGKMNYLTPCCCLIGVASSETLHQQPCKQEHYGAESSRVIARFGAAEISGNLSQVDYAYCCLNLGPSGGQSARDAELIALIKGVLEERKVAVEKENVNEPSYAQ